MDSHYHEEGGAMLEVNIHRTACPICSPTAVEAVEIPAEVPVVPIRRPHRKAPHRPEAA